MNHPERGSRRITSIPRQTSLDVLRNGGSLPGGARSVSREPAAGETDWSKIAAKHVFQKPPGRENARLKPLYGRDGRIEWKVEVFEDYNGKGDMGIILQFAGIGFTKVSFLRSRHNKLDSPVFYIPIDYNKRIARLFFATRGDIFESQVVPAQMDVNPFFQEELYLPQLTTTHDPASMTVFQNNGFITVSYNPRTY